MQKLYFPVLRFRDMPPVFGLSLGGLLGLLLAVFVVGNRAQQQTDQLFAEYGKALAGLTAERAADSAGNSDLVGLHTIVQDVVAQQRATFASAHDAQGTLLVQAGESFTGRPAVTFSADIPLQGEQAGSIRVVLASDFQGDQMMRWSILATACLLLVMMVLALYDSYGEFWWLGQKSLARKANGKRSTTGDDFAGGSDADPWQAADGSQASADEGHVDDHAARCVLTVTALNLRLLEQTLSGEMFERLMADLERKLDHVVMVYGGKIINEQAIDLGMQIEFYADERTSEALFQSVCAAHLLQALLSDSKVRPRLNAYASVNGNVGLIKREGIFCENVETSEFLSARLDVEEIETNVFWVRGLKAPFSELVEQQLLRLRAAASP